MRELTEKRYEGEKGGLPRRDRRGEPNRRGRFIQVQVKTKDTGGFGGEGKGKGGRNLLSRREDWGGPKNLKKGLSVW